VTEWDWAPLSLDEVAELLRDFSAPWWIAGGHALELFLGRTIRQHEDIDVAVLRSDQLTFQRHLRGWDLQIAHGGRLTPWPEGKELEPPEHGIWARREAGGPWELQVLFDSDTGGVWHYRRDPAVRLPVDDLGLVSTQGLPYLRPEIVLLFKAKAPREKDEADLEAVLPALDAAARARLRRWLARSEKSPDSPATAEPGSAFSS
jgi:hypothetical protein